MSRVSIEMHETGEAVLDGPFGKVTVADFECDGCRLRWPMADRYVVWHKPWHGEYWGDILWTGQCCAEKLGAEHWSLGNPDEREGEL